VVLLDEELLLEDHEHLSLVVHFAHLTKANTKRLLISFDDIIKLLELSMLVPYLFDILPHLLCGFMLDADVLRSLNSHGVGALEMIDLLPRLLLKYLVLKYETACLLLLLVAMDDAVNYLAGEVLVFYAVQVELCFQAEVLLAFVGHIRMDDLEYWVVEAEGEGQLILA